MNASFPVEIGAIVRRRVGGMDRVEAPVDGRPVWFESADVALRPSGEAFASCFLVPALAARRPLRIRAPLDAAWLGNIARVLPFFSGWWGYPAGLPIECEGESPPTGPKPDAALCFSAGVDSFHTLLCRPYATQYLATVHGFDISIRDAHRMRRLRPTLAAVAQTVGKTPVVVRTNLRKHPLFASAPWERSHGTALAAVGHLLGDVAGRLVVASSYTTDDPTPWGSHWQIDPLLSASGMQIVHDATTLQRFDKIRALADQPLAQRHLRVCWENLSPSGNCSRCDKCLVAMITLYLCGRLDRFRVFDTRTPLPTLVDRRGPVTNPLYRRHYARLLELGLPGRLDAAVRRLLARTAPPPFTTLRRAFAKAELALARLCG